MSSVVKETISPNLVAEPMPLPNGPAAAAILAGGIGTAWYGLLVILAESVKNIGNLLNFYKPSGPLSGKTTVGVLGFLLIWAVLHNLWKGKDVEIEKVWTVSLALIVIGLVLTFPPVFLFFAGE
ncbi:MAG: hypothetical protein M1602_07115 [Firmicutes bacterium]|nr:hypothetical protein [Bacillota bacterium]